MPRRIFIFNPETDYALAAGRTRYNPPSPIIKLRKSMQLIQAYQAEEGDIIVVSPDFDPSSYPDQEALRLLRMKGVDTVKLMDLAKYMEETAGEPSIINPWGWNHSLRGLLLEAGIPEALLKSDEEIDKLRQLAHRHTVVPFQKHLQGLLPDLEVPAAIEFFSADEALEFAEREGDVFFKAPWSSSGRGLLRVTKDEQKNPSPQLPDVKMKEWLNGFIRRQGSVMGEIAFSRVADFATEWHLHKGEARFKGLSLFTTTPAGRYTGNVMLSQSEIFSRLSSLSRLWDQKIIQAQGKALETLIAVDYSGPVGIDMLIDAVGAINPCVEINLRTTMGMIELYRQASLANYPGLQSSR